MADLTYVKRNRLFQEVKAKQIAYVKNTAFVSFPITLILLVLFPSLTFALLLAGASMILLFGTFILSKDRVLLDGAIGEVYTLNILKRLPAGYIIFNQVDVPDEFSSTGFREIDFIVCGPTGIFVIESKNYVGNIVGNEQDLNWTKHKISRKGNFYSNSVRNPIKQIKTQVAVLKKHLRIAKLNPWVTPIVALSLNNSLEHIKSDSVPVVNSSDLVMFITAYDSPYPVKNFDDVISAIVALR